MEQIKCNECQFTKFFVNSIGGATVFSCSDCGASLIMQTPVQQEEQPKQVEEPEELEVTVIENKVVEQPTPITSQEAEKEKPGAVKITPEQKAQLEEMQKGGE